MKKTKNIIAITIAIAMLLTIVPVYADSYTITAIYVDGAAVNMINNSGTGTKDAPYIYEYTINTLNGNVDEKYAPQITADVSDATQFYTEVAVYNSTAEGTVFRVNSNRKRDNVTFSEKYVLIKLIGDNMYKNGSMEQGSDIALYGYDSAGNKVHRGTATAVNDGASATGNYHVSLKVPGSGYQFPGNHAVTDEIFKEGTTYIVSNKIKLLGKTAGKAGTVYWYFDQKSENNFTYGPKTYRDGELVDEDTSYSFVPSEEKYENIETVFTPAEDLTDTLCYLCWGDGAVIALDDYFVGELVCGGTAVTNADGDARTLVSPESQVVLDAHIYNQLGTETGFDLSDITWTSTEGISVDNNGVVTIPRDAPTGNYEVSFTKNITENNIGKVSGTHRIVVYEEESSLKSLTIDGSGVGKFDFAPEVTDYSVGVAVKHIYDVDDYSYEIPSVSAKALTDGYTVEYDMPETLPGEAKVFVKEGNKVKQTYTINFYLMGTNMYRNGSFETSEHCITTAYNENTYYKFDSSNPGDGDFAMNISNIGMAYVFNPRQTLTGGKTYLTSSMVRLNNGDTDSYEILYRIDPLPAYSKSVFYQGQTVNSKSNENKESAHGYRFPITKDWQTTSASITPGENWTDFQFYIDPDFTNNGYSISIDNSFLGELVISGAELVSDGEALPSIVCTDSNSRYTLGAQALNQLGTNCGLEDKTIATITSVKTPSGVSYDNGVLTVPAGSEGRVEVNVRVTPNSNWTNAPQIEYRETVTLNLTTDRNVSLFVSPDGDDYDDGSIDNPLATFKGARDRARKLKAADSSLNINVLVRGGTYNTSGKLRFDFRDSGTEEAPVIWQNYNNEEVVIKGSMDIPGTEFTKVDDEAILSRIVDESARDRLYSVSLSKIGLSSLGEPFLRGSVAYSNALKDVDGMWKKSSFNEIYLDGEAMHLARYPNDSDMSIAAVVEPGWNDDNPDEYPYGTPFKITVSDGRVKKWSTVPTGSAIMYGFWKYKWADQAIPIDRIDISDNTLVSKWPSVYGVSPNATFYVYNLLEELDADGEYFADGETLYVSYSGDISSSVISIVTLTDDLFEINGAENMIFRGLNFKELGSGAFNVTGTSDSILIEDCEMSWTSKRAVALSGTNNTVRNCYIHDVNGGVSVSGGDTFKLIRANNRVINNHIERYSRLTKTYVSAVGVSGVGNLVAFNEIHDAPHQAIEFAGQLNRISYNNIYDVLNETDDAGAIYGGLSWLPRGNEVSYNYIHDISGKGATSNSGVRAVYMDGGMCDVDVIGNIFYNIKGGQMIRLSGGRDNVVKDNYAINCNVMMHINQLLTPESLDRHKEQLKNMSGVLESEEWKEAFPEFFEMMELSDEDKLKMEGNVFENNLCVNTALIMGSGADTFPDRETDNCVIKEDPGFADMEGKDFTLSLDAPILEEFPTIRRLPFACMGISGQMACVDGGFYLDKIGGICECTLCYEAGEELNAFLGYAAYSIKDGADVLDSVAKDTLTLSPGERLHKKEIINIKPGRQIKTFLWDEKTLIPLVKSGTVSTDSP